MSVILLLLVLLNFAISWFNAWSVGRGWAESKAAGGGARFMSWMGAVMSASGFTWCYLVVLCVGGMAIPGKYHLPEKYANAIFGIGYLMIIIPVLGSGIAITVQSWMHFWKTRSFGSGAVAGWNTFADVYNTYTAVKAVPEIFGSLKNLWDSEDSDSDAKTKLFGLLIIAAVLCLVGGCLTTAAIVRTTARSVAVEEMRKAKMSAFDKRSWSEA